MNRYRVQIWRRASRVFPFWLTECPCCPGSHRAHPTWAEAMRWADRHATQLHTAP